jgi:DNA-binding transcriptional LysR family regulator
MQLETLKVFCDVVETRSFSKAAILNYISQSAVSQQMRSLEEKYDHKLIERGKRNLKPTPAGELLYDTSKNILTHLDDLEQQLQQYSKNVVGEVKIATIYSVGMHELHSYITKFMKRYPTARIRVEYDRANRIYDSVIGNAIDIGIVAYPARRSGLQILPFIEDELVLVCNPAHPLAKQSRIDVKKLAGVQFIGFEKDIPTRRAIDRILRSNRTKIDMVMEFDNLETIKRGIEINSGVSILPKMTVEREVHLGTLATVKFSKQSHKRPLGILIKRGRKIAPVMQRFLSVLTEEA